MHRCAPGRIAADRPAVLIAPQDSREHTPLWRINARCPPSGVKAIPSPAFELKGSLPMSVEPFLRTSLHDQRTIPIRSARGIERECRLNFRARRTSYPAILCIHDAHKREASKTYHKAMKCHSLDSVMMRRISFSHLPMNLCPISCHRASKAGHGCAG